MSAAAYVESTAAVPEEASVEARAEPEPVFIDEVSEDGGSADCSSLYCTRLHSHLKQLDRRVCVCVSV